MLANFRTLTLNALNKLVYWMQFWTRPESVSAEPCFPQMNNKMQAYTLYNQGFNDIFFQSEIFLLLKYRNDRMKSEFIKGFILNLENISS